MQRAELITKIAEEAGITKKTADIVLNSFLDGITETLTNGEKLTFVGFGTFSVACRQKRTGINPKTKEKIEIPERKVPVFKAGKTLKDFVK